MHETLYNTFFKGSLLVYLFEVIFTDILFDILGVKKGYALIPFYNIYRLYEEYTGRVWLKNWGKIFFIAFITLSIVVLVLTILSGGVFVYLIMAIIVFFTPLLILIRFIVNSLFLVTHYLPILENKFFKALLVVNLLFPLIINLVANSIYINEEYTYSSIYSLINVGFMFIYLVSAVNIRKKVKNGQYVLYEKLDYEKLSYDEIRAELKSRGRMLAHPVDDEKDYYSQFNQEIEDKKEDIE